MLTKKLFQVKRELEAKIYKDEDDRKTLSILSLIEKDPRYNQNFGGDDILQKSFSVAPDRCPTCGK